jgi:acyl-CoA synthetase (AMP-forming)/AMP-acid ligase II
MSAIPPNPDPEPQSVFAAFAASAARYAGHPFLQVPASACRHYAQGELNYTYAEAWREIAALSDCYAAAGLRAGMRAALLLENRPAYFFHWFALNGLGVGVVPVNADYRSAELRFLFEHSEAALAVSITERVADLKAATRGIPVVDAANLSRELDSVKPAGAPDASGLEAECGLLYTSGTTGKPKGCLLSNEYYLRAGRRYMNRRGRVKVVPGRSRVLTPLPMFHMNAMAGSTLGMVMSGGCVIQLDRFHPKTWWSDVSASRATGVHYLGVMPAILLELPVAPEERAHCVLYGSGANVEPKHHAAFEARFGFPLVEGWAMTETGSGGVCSADEEPRHVGTRCFGRPSAEVELRLGDDDGNPVPDGEPGEILARAAGANPRRGFFTGYLKDEAATVEGWAGGWWHSGDIARRGPDGSYFFVDRKKNVIRRSGENISALEVETVLLQHPAISQVGITSVADDLRGEEVIACIVPAQGVPPDTVSARAIVEWSLGQMAYYKAPGWVAFVNALPVTATQKVQRGELRAVAALQPGTARCYDMRTLKRRA